MDVIRIGLIWPDSSHADRFSELCNLPAEDNSGDHIDGARVVGLWGEDSERNLTLSEKFGIELIADRKEDLIGHIDLAVVASRNGALHLELARPFLEAGVATFVDKPIANRLGDARAISDLARKHGTPITSFSTYRIASSVARLRKEQLASLGRFTFGEFTGPGQLENEYGGLIFYGIHAAELALEFMGPGADRVRCSTHGGNTSATVIWPDDRSATVNVLGNAAYTFHVSLYGPDGHHSEVPDASRLYPDGLEIALEMARSRKEPLEHEIFIESIALIEAMNASMSSGQTEAIAKA
jgi:predicted dehydrogenase